MLGLSLVLIQGPGSFNQQQEWSGGNFCGGKGWGRRRDQLSRTFLWCKVQMRMAADSLGRGLGFLPPGNSLLDLEEWSQVGRLPQKCRLAWGRVARGGAEFVEAELAVLSLAVSPCRCWGNNCSMLKTVPGMKMRKSVNTNWNWSF